MLNYDIRKAYPRDWRIKEITDLSAPELEPFCGLSEVQLLRSREPQPGIFIAESAKVILRALDAGYTPISLLAEHSRLEQCAGELIRRCPDIPVYTASSDVLEKLTGYCLTGGVLCAMNRRKLPTIQEICAGARRIAVLENVQNPTNVGAIVRSAAALNIDAVILTRGCSDPLYRRAARVSMGTIFQIPWTFADKRLSWPLDGISLLHELGFRTAAMALKNDSVSINDPRLRAEEKLAIVLGAEGDGLSESTIAECDYTVRIPMSQGVDSLNVAAASAVAFWQLGQ